MMDVRIIYRRFEKIKANMGMLREAAQASYVQFTGDPVLYYATERALQVCIQAIIDICAYLVKESQTRMPEEYRDLAAIMVKMGVIPADMEPRLVSMIGMRNILVHQYLEIDLSIVHRSLQSDLEDFDRFARYVEDYLEREGVE